MDRAIVPQNRGKAHHAENFERPAQLLWSLVKNSLIMAGQYITVYDFFFNILKSAKNIGERKRKT